jgi:DNA-binding transcriptional regulator YdaS (Cro superfamily)
MGEEKEVVVPEDKNEAPPAKAAEAARKYTDDDMNNLIAKGKADAVEGVLKELGIPTVADAKKNLAALKAWQDSQKTDAQKALDDAKASTERATAAETRATKAEMMAEALRAGVDPEKLDDAIALAEKAEGATAAEKVKATIEKRAWLLGKEVPAAFGAKVKGQEVDAKAKAQAEVNAAFGLK